MSDLVKREAALRVQPSSYKELFEFAKMASGTNLVPKNYIGKPNDVFIAMQLGIESGLNPLYSVQNIAVINGRPSIFGDAMLALVMASGFVEDFSEVWDEGSKSYTCTAIRRGITSPSVATFSMDDAKKAELLNNIPWKKYPKRMCQMRARGFCLRSLFADVIGGIHSREESMDLKEVDIQVMDSVPADQASLMATDEDKKSFFADVEGEKLKSYLTIEQKTSVNSEISKETLIAIFDSLIESKEEASKEKGKPPVTAETNTSRNF